jgi:hypothetical protein
MKKINLRVSALTLFLITSSLSCALLALPSVPKLENRTLRLSHDNASLEYHYFKCSKSFMGLCVNAQRVDDIYDLSKTDVREQLIDMGFVCKVREKIY